MECNSMIHSDIDKSLLSIFWSRISFSALIITTLYSTRFDINLNRF